MYDGFVKPTRDPPPPSAPARGAPQALLTTDEHDEIAGMATADDGLFASVEAQPSGLGAAPDAQGFEGMRPDMRRRLGMLGRYGVTLHRGGAGRVPQRNERADEP